MTEEEKQIIEYISLSAKQKRRIRLQNAEPAPF